MRTKFITATIRTAIGALRVLQWIGVLVWTIFRLIGRPLQWFGRGIFRILLPAYSRYLRLKQRFNSDPQFRGVRSIGHFVTRYALYATIVLLGVLGVTNNLFARTIQPDTVGQGSVWVQLVQTETNDVIVDDTGAIKPIGATANQLAVGGLPVAVVTVAAPNANSSINGQTNDTGVVGIDSNGGTSNAVVRSGVTDYVVQGGDTIGSIATAYNVTGSTIRWANGLSGDLIKPGQKLRIPPVSGVLYSVQKGDTLLAIANKYSGKPQDILDENGLISADSITTGQEIIIPNGTPPAPPAPVAPQRNLLAGIIGSHDTIPSATTAPPSSTQKSAKFIWPTTSHRINQYFRGRSHTGVDIDGGYSSPIYAAAAGVVVYAAFDKSGYGLHIVIDHGNGYQTLYGHASKIFVSEGDRVRQGQTIAMVGSTGHSTGPHLHFEIRGNGGFYNPLGFF